MPHHPVASPASPASPAFKTWGAANGAPLWDQAPRLRGHENGLRVGVVLTFLPGVWRGQTPITLTYQWTRDGASIAGATGASYTLVAADVPGHVIAVNETAANGVSSLTVTNYQPAYS